MCDSANGYQGGAAYQATCSYNTLSTPATTCVRRREKEGKKGRKKMPVRPSVWKKEFRRIDTLASCQPLALMLWPWIAGLQEPPSISTRGVTSVATQVDCTLLRAPLEEVILCVCIRFCRSMYCCRVHALCTGLFQFDCDIGGAFVTPYNFQCVPLPCSLPYDLGANTANNTCVPATRLDSGSSCAVACASGYSMVTWREKKCLGVLIYTNICFSCSRLQLPYPTLATREC